VPRSGEQVRRPINRDGFGWARIAQNAPLLVSLELCAFLLLRGDIIFCGQLSHIDRNAVEAFWANGCPSR
jgi:hypothetical protein